MQEYVTGEKIDDCKTETPLRIRAQLLHVSHCITSVIQVMLDDARDTYA